MNPGQRRRHLAEDGFLQVAFKEVGRFVPSTVITLKIARYFEVPLEEVFFLNDAG